MEVKDISELYSKAGTTLDRGAASHAPSQMQEPSLNILVVSPELKLQSSFSRTAKYVLNTLKSNKTLAVNNYEIKTREIDELIKLLPTTDILFFIVPLTITDNILQLIKSSPRNFECWYYFKPDSNSISTQMAEWLNKEFSAIFVPSNNLRTTLKGRVHRPVELLNFGASSEFFYSVDKESARKIINIPSGKRIWLAPAANTKSSRLDIIIQSFVEYLSVNKEKAENDILLCLGDMSNSTGYTLQNIFANELVAKNLDKKKYETSVVFLEPTRIREGLPENVLNYFYNAADYIIFANSYSNYSYTPIECIAVSRSKVICPRHSCFIESFKDATNVAWCDPIQGLYRTALEGDGIDYIIHPGTLIKIMRELVENETSAADKTVTNNSGETAAADGADKTHSFDGSKQCAKTLEKRVLITQQERQG